MDDVCLSIDTRGISRKQSGISRGTRSSSSMLSAGEAPKRAKQLFRALYGNGHWIRDLDQMDRNTAAAYSAAFKAKVGVQPAPGMPDANARSSNMQG